MSSMLTEITAIQQLSNNSRLMVFACQLGIASSSPLVMHDFSKKHESPNVTCSTLLLLVNQHVRSILTVDQMQCVDTLTSDLWVLCLQYDCFSSCYSIFHLYIVLNLLFVCFSDNFYTDQDDEYPNLPTNKVI